MGLISQKRTLFNKRNYLPTLNFSVPNEGHWTIQTGNTASLSIFTYMCTDSSAELRPLLL